MEFLAFFIARFVDPSIFVVAVVLGFFFAKKWQHVLVCGLVTALLGEVLLHSFDLPQSFGRTFLPGIILSTGYAWLAYKISPFVHNRRKDEDQSDE